MDPVRSGKRAPHQLRPHKISIDTLDFADGSAFIEVGRTRVLAAATIDERVPPFLRGTGQGWVTAEYAMLPRATDGADAPRAGGRPHLGTDPGDPAPRRPRPAGGDGPARPRREADHHRLRRHPGRRRNARGLGHGRLRRAGPGPQEDDRPGPHRPYAPPPSGRRSERRHRQGPGARRPRLLGGLPGRPRHERHRDRPGRARRSPGRGGEEPLLAKGAARAPQAGRPGHRQDHQAAEGNAQEEEHPVHGLRVQGKARPRQGAGLRNPGLNPARLDNLPS